MYKKFKNCYGVIYLTTNMCNNKIYIGKTIKDDKNYLGSGIAITNSIKKYGKENFKKEILCECFSKKELNLKEIEFIFKYDSMNPKIGYNKSPGGDGAQKGNIPWNKGLSYEEMYGERANEEKIKCTNWKNGNPLKFHTEETKKKMCENHADFNGKNNPFYGKTHTEETKIVIKKKCTNWKNGKHPFLGRKHSKETKKLQREIKLKNVDTNLIIDLYFENLFISEITIKYNCMKNANIGDRVIRRVIKELDFPLNSRGKSLKQEEIKIKFIKENKNIREKFYI
jgi:hypothetical protein